MQVAWPYSLVGHDDIQFLKMPGKYGLPFRWSVKEESNKVVMTTIGLNSDGQLSNISTSTLKSNIATWLADYRMINDYVQIEDGAIINLGLEIDLVYEWELGSMLIFDRTNLHCSSSKIDGKKIGLTTFTKK